jgi:hypothetical protein
MVTREDFHLSGYKGLYQDEYLARSEFGKEASGTIGDYLTGTITLVFAIFFLFLLLSALTIMLTTYARYKERLCPPNSFRHPPPRAYRPRLQVSCVLLFISSVCNRSLAGARDRRIQGHLGPEHAALNPRTNISLALIFVSMKMSNHRQTSYHNPLDREL